MALIARGMYKLLLRTSVKQEISQEGWQFIISSVLPWEGESKQGLPRFDGELLCFSAMNPMDMSILSEQLMSYGYKWQEDLRDSDFAWFAFNVPKLEWLEEVDARPLRDELPKVVLWQVRNSELRSFADHDGRIWRKGKDYIW